jgi:shikimate dehydrogenase
MRRRLGLIGFPVEHSLSPAFQQPALDALGIDATYELWPTPPDQVADVMAALREPDVIGANVTVPHKQTVIPFLDELSDTALRAGAVNTIIPRNARLTGDNTDVPGLVRALREAGISEAGFSALLLGAGGAARGAMLALEALGVERVAIANRSPQRAGDIALLVPGIACQPVNLLPSSLEVVLPTVDLVINATSLGWNPSESPISPDLLRYAREECLVADLTYRDTLLLNSARRYGLRTLDGLPMLVYQGARSLELWTGLDAPVPVMMAAAVEARSARA